ncbi:MAG: Abi family protein [Saprospiraceae bacterium]
MRFKDFEKTMSPGRVNRYLAACNGDTKKTMMLYRLNLRLSQEMFTVISCFEVALRNAIDRHYLDRFGNDWVRDSAVQGGIFDHQNCSQTTNSINDEVRSLGNRYSHDKLIAGLGFGFWRYLFAPHQYQRAGSNLLDIFPAKPRSTAQTQYNQTFVFKQLAALNEIRNRIAHHEPICFIPRQSVKDTTYARQHYGHILQLFQWMTINEAALLYGLDHINQVCDNIDSL